MKALELKMPDETYRKLADLAAHDAQAVDEFAVGKIEQFLRAAEDFAELERRAQRGDPARFATAMQRVPAIPPMAGDEMPG